MPRLNDCINIDDSNGDGLGNGYGDGLGNGNGYGDGNARQLVDVLVEAATSTTLRGRLQVREVAVS